MDCLNMWPEPVVPVQAISDSGIAAVPDRYIKPPSERPGAGGGAPLHIPVVNLGGLATGTVQCRDTIQAVSDACREWGFVQVVNHGVDPGLMRRVRETWREFFYLPMSEKKKHANSPMTYEGYGSRMGVEKGAILDWGDYFFLHYLPLHLRDPSKWPALPPSCRDTTEEYAREVVKLCGVMMRVLSIGLGLEAGQLLEAFGGDDGVGAGMRVNIYPKCPQPDLTLGLSAHSDPGGLTVLLADDHVTGLQVRKDGEWVTIQPVPDAFIINVGDQIQVLSNACYKSVEHRALVNAAQDRLSVALFYNPRSDLSIGPVPELVSGDHPSQYEAMTFDQYRLSIRTRGLVKPRPQ